jgi:uncharacterized membrane protein YuzA (DUF378 family)
LSPVGCSDFLGGGFGPLNGIVFSFIFRLVHQMDLVALVFGVKQVLVQQMDYLVVAGQGVLELVGSPLEEIGQDQKFDRHKSDLE